MTTKPRPVWCRSCDETTRLVELPDGRMAHCGSCHPLAPTSLPGLLERRDRLHTELLEVDRLIAAAQAPDWVRGPGPVRP